MLCSAHIAQAVYPIYWKGGNGSEENPVNIYSKSSWTGSDAWSGNDISKNPCSDYNMHYGFAADTQDMTAWLKCYGNDVDTAIADYIITHSGHFIFTSGSFKAKSYYVGYSTGDDSKVTKKSGIWKITENMDVGYGSKSIGVLTINGGTLDVASDKRICLGYSSGSSGTLNLNGGVIKTSRVVNNKGVGVLNLNGGTLQANADNTTDFIQGVTVNINAGGGVIDCGGKAIKINTSLAGSGGLLFTGGSRIDIGHVGVGYDGATSVVPGTTLSVYQYGAANNILNNGLVIPGVPTVGQTIFILTRGSGYTFEREDSAWMSGKRPVCPIAPETKFELVDASNIVVTAVGDLLPGWYIGPTDGNLSVGANWSNGVVPTSGNATISCSSAATLTVGETFAPSAITFAAGSAPVAINGRDLTGIVAVTNLSSVSHTINAKVYFKEDIKVSQSAMGGVDDLAKPHVTFAGGAYAAKDSSLESSNTDPVYSRCIFGEYFLSNDKSTPWEVGESSDQRRNCLADKSILHIPFAGNIGAIYVGIGAKAFVGDMETSGRVSYRNYGEMIVTNLTLTGSSNVHATSGQGIDVPAVFKFGSVTNKMTSGSGFYLSDFAKASKHVFYIGKGGINYDNSNSDTVYYLGRNASSNYETIRPWYSDFTIGARSGDGVGLNLRRDVEFCTDDESGIGRTITMDAVTCAQDTPRIYISGSGTLKVNKAAQNAVEPSITLKDTATLEYATATATLGTGTIVLGAGTTFAFKNSGRELVLPSSSITLPSTGVATLRIDGAKIKSGDYTIATGVAADAADHLVIDSASTALVGRKASLRVDDGNLVLTIKSTGTVCIVR